MTFLIFLSREHITDNGSVALFLKCLNSEIFWHAKNVAYGIEVYQLESIRWSRGGRE